MSQVSSDAAETKILVEGYDDRNFIAGWLERRGFLDPGKLAGGRRTKVLDLGAKAVQLGQFAFLDPTKRVFVRIVPCEGDSKVLQDAKVTIKEFATDTTKLRRLVLCVDSDQMQGGEQVSAAGYRANLRSLAQEQGFDVAPGDDLRVSTEGRELEIDVVVWTVDAASSPPDIPDKQTLERVVCAALCKAWPDRGPTVTNWLKTVPKSDHHHKQHAWSHVAGWHAEHGAGFYRLLWKEDQVATHLEGLLEITGTLKTLQRATS